MRRGALVRFFFLRCLPHGQPQIIRRLLLKVQLPDGNEIEVADGATALDVASSIGSGLARAAIAGKMTKDDRTEIVDLQKPLPGDCELAILTASDEDPDSLYVLRHSAAHVAAEAICKLFPEAKLVYGPPVENGFYYDIELSQSITPEDFPRIEAEMKRIVQEKRPFCRHEAPREEAMVKLRDEGNRYKIDNAERAEGDKLSFYVTGENVGSNFEDLCIGPHVPSTAVIKAFKIRQVSRSHYRGDVNDTPLQRVYGTAFFKKDSLDAYLTQLEEAKKRDHRVIGRDLGLFVMSEQVGAGLALWLPKGMTVRTQLQNYLTDEMIKLGYELVCTPQIGQLGLYRTSGHYPYYEDSQYPAMFESDRGKAIQSALQLAQRVEADRGSERKRGEVAVQAMISAMRQAWGAIEGLRDDAPLPDTIERLYAALASEQGYLLRPMNCPHHIGVYMAHPRSYRDLPMRIAEFGMVYRWEQSGELSGMIRVRGFTQDDAHLFCTPDQLAHEVLTTVKLSRQVLEVLNLYDYRVRIGLRDLASDKYVGSPENWAKAEAAIHQAAVESGMNFSEEKGEAAFYGPKIDFIVKDCIGRSWQLGTVQVDYNLPERFGLSYIGPDNAPHVPIMIHRAPFGSMERFVGILIEHFAGAFPMWLSPVQVAVATISEKSEAYGRQIYDTLKNAGLRVELDLSSEKIGPKKHRLRTAKINYILVVGEKEAQDNLLNVNDRDGRTIGNMTVGAFIGACQQEIVSKGDTCVGV
ncbi:MAG: threonine--tRNA ligase [Phycisphaerales bacterium]|nr:MAG: threonine--tRNA ligase [Phycisphaerales bacterium]